MNRGQARALAHSAIFFMGIAGVLAQASGFQAWRTTSYRVVFGGGVLVLVSLMRRGRWPSWPRALLFLGMGVLLSIHWFAFFRSIELLGVMLGSALIGLEPLFIALAGAVFLKEPLSRQTILALGISMIGFVCLGLGGSASPMMLQGVAWSVFSFVLFAILIVVNRLAVQNEGALTVTTLEMLGAIPLAVWMTPGDWLPADSNSWLFALALGLLCTGMAHLFYNLSIKVLPTPEAGLLISLEVVYGLLGGWCIGDRLSLYQWLAVMLIGNIIVMDLWLWWRQRGRGLA